MYELNKYLVYYYSFTRFFKRRKILKNILTEVEKSGYCITTISDFYDIEFLVSRLGTLLSRTTIADKDNPFKFFQSNLEIRMHTDDPYVRVLGLYCVSPAVNGGESLILDLNNFFNTLSDDEVDEFRQMKMRVPVNKFTRQFNILDEEYIISEKGYYYFPFNNNLEYTEKQFSLLDRLNKFANDITNLTEIKLKAKELIIYDNKRMAHGRNYYQDGVSKRHFIRYWIK